METKIVVHSDFSNTMESLRSIPESFEKLDITLQQGRNEIKVLQLGGEKFVIKSFQKVTVANKFIYRFFRKSKARRSYENAIQLLERNINTPKPVAYIEQYDGMFLTASYFISSFVGYPSFHDEKKRFNNKNLITDFSHFLYYIHQQGVFHMDLNMANVLCEEDADGRYTFYLIDNNRMRFCEPTEKRITKNLDHIVIPFDLYSVMVREYATLAGFDPYYFVERLLFSRKKNTTKRRVKSKLKEIVGL